MCSAENKDPRDHIHEKGVGILPRYDLQKINRAFNSESNGDATVATAVPVPVI